MKDDGRASGLWLGLVICEQCFLVQRFSVSTVTVVYFIDAEYVKGCERCGGLYSRYHYH